MWYYVALILAWPAWCVLRALAGLGRGPAEPAKPAKRINFDPPASTTPPPPVIVHNPYGYEPLE